MDTTAPFSIARLVFRGRKFRHRELTLTPLGAKWLRILASIVSCIIALGATCENATAAEQVAPFLKSVATTPYESKPAYGVFDGKKFKVDQAVWDGQKLVLSQGKIGAANRCYFSIEEIAKKGSFEANWPATKYSLEKDFMRGQPGPEIVKAIDNKTKLLLENKTFTVSPILTLNSHQPSISMWDGHESKYNSQSAMRLTFGKFNSQGLLPGHIILRVEGGSCVQGYFYAGVSKSLILR